MIVEMCKLKMLGLNSQKDKLLNVLFETGKVELNKVEQLDEAICNFDENAYEEIEIKKEKLKKIIDFVEKCAEEYRLKADDMIEVDIDTFKNADTKEVKKIIAKIEDLHQKIEQNQKKINSYQAKINKFLPYLPLKERFSSFKGSKTVDIFLGIIPTHNITVFDNFLKDFPFTIYQIDGENIIKVYSHKDESQDVYKKLSELGVAKCDINCTDTAENVINQAKKQILKCEEDIEKHKKEVADYIKSVNKLKLLYDFLQFNQQKLDADNLFASTESTFFLEAFLAKDCQEFVTKSLENSGCAIEFEFSSITKKDNPPVIIKNNKIVTPFEFVTNMYSPPNYRELDPNGFIAFFFSLFFGFVMADIGYGLCFLLLGFILYMSSKKNSGFKNLMGVIAVCGVSTIIFGVLFGSFFGLDNSKISIIPKAILPNPIKDVMTLLIACLGAGVVQIMVSFFLKGVLAIKRKQPLVAIFSGFIWEFFFVGLILICLQVLGLATNTFNLGLIIAVISLVISVIGQIVINKGFDKVAKGFGAIYGIINIMSDILSYARLFGLMLSGAIISSIVNDLAMPFFNNFFMAILGSVILIFGHSFNMFMGALSAYIHVSRLQYVEFFSRFYEGEGELFRPFGRDFSYLSNIKTKI